MPNTFCLVGGGTGGHIVPILSLVENLKQPRDNFFWVGGKDSMEQAKSSEAGIRFVPITTYKLTSTKSLGVLLYPFKLLQGIWEARNILKQEQPKLVFSKGGPGSVAVGIAAWTLGIPLYIHESDTVPGFSNKVLGHFATRIFLGFEEARKCFPIYKTTIVGQILHPQFFNKDSVISQNLEPLEKGSHGLDISLARSGDMGNLSGKSKPKLPLVGLIGTSRTENSTVSEKAEIGTQSSHFTKTPIQWKTNKKRIFVSCGSQGSRKIFQTLLDQKKNFPDTEWIISLGTLNGNMRSEFETWEDTQVFDWIPQSDIPHILDGAEIAVTRASATTLAELATRPIHLVIVPLAISAGNHQLQNARVYEQDGHTVLLESDLESSDIGEILESPHLIPHYDTQTRIFPLLEIFG